MSTDQCTCSRIQVGMQTTNNRNWRPECPVHGVNSVWYKTEGRQAHERARQRALELQRQASEARKAIAKKP